MSIMTVIMIAVAWYLSSQTTRSGSRISILISQAFGLRVTTISWMLIMARDIRVTRGEPLAVMFSPTDFFSIHQRGISQLFGGSTNWFIILFMPSFLSFVFPLLLLQLD